MVKMSQSGRTGLPGEIKTQDFPKQSYVISQPDDSITGVDACHADAISKVKKHMSKSK